MAVTYATTQRNARMQVIADALNGGSLEITTSADGVLSTHSLAVVAGNHGQWRGARKARRSIGYALHRAASHRRLRGRE